MRGDAALLARIVELVEAEDEDDGEEFLAPDQERLGEAVSEVRRQLRNEETDPEAGTLATDEPRAKDRRASHMLEIGLSERPGSLRTT